MKVGAFIHKHKETLTALTRDGEYDRGEELADVENCNNGFFSNYAA